MKYYFHPDAHGVRRNARLSWVILTTDLFLCWHTGIKIGMRLQLFFLTRYEDNNKIFKIKACNLPRIQILEIKKRFRISKPLIVLF